MVQGQGFCIITWKPTIERASLIGKLGMCWADLWTEPYEPSPVPSSNTVKVFFFVGINFRGFVKNYKFVDSYIRGFCVCTKIKFHWVSKLWESFNTLDKWAVELCNRQWNMDINVFIFSIFFYIYSVLARISKGQGATSEKGTFKSKRWLKKGTLFLDCFYN
jgi:hypothetical protein